MWRRAETIVLVGASSSLGHKTEALHKPIEARFPDQTNVSKAILKQLRLHQWSKNVLVFAPLLLGHHFLDGTAWLHSFLAFLGLCTVASATYVVNDLADLAADRSHATKRRRPVASGDLSIALACVVASLMLAVGFALAYAARPDTALVLLAYLALTLTYSFTFKRVPLLDTAIIGLLFTMRIVIGCVAAELQPSPWLLAFSVMLFFSLAMAKRQTELTKMARLGEGQKIVGRGYRADDAILSLVYGVTSGVASLVILMLYTTNSAAAGLYRDPAWLWFIPLLLYLWQMRIWLLAHRGVLDDDPIVFALKDRISLVLGVGCAIAFELAI